MTAFQTFMEKIRKGISEYCGEAYRVEIDEIEKNNGKEYHGITITEIGSNISPTIYLDELYQKYVEGLPLSAIMKKVIEIYEKYRIDQKIDVGFLTDFSWVKEHILFKLVGYEKNKEQLQEIPHIKLLDMAIVFYCGMLHDTLGSITVLVKNELCRMWNTNAEELLALAEVNTPRIMQTAFLGMGDIVKELGNVEDTEIAETAAAWENCLEEEEIRMYVLTNRQKQFGAACIRYPNVLQQMAERLNDSFLILPSSVHEVILVPERTVLSVKEFKRIVYEINRTHVAWEEVLTDSVYRYDREKQELTRI